MVVAMLPSTTQHELLVGPNSWNPRQRSRSSICSTHSRSSLVKRNPSCPTRRVRFNNLPDEDLSQSFSCPSESDSFEVQLHIREFDPEITDENSPDVFFTAHEIMRIRSDVRKLATRFAADYPDYVETLDDLYLCGKQANLEAAQKTLRRRRKRVQSMQLAEKWDNLFNEFDEDDCCDEDREECCPARPTIEDCFCDDDAEENHLHYGETRGLESRLSSSFRVRRKQVIRKVLELQNEMRENDMSVNQIEMCLCARAVQLTRNARDFASNQGCLDAMDMKDNVPSN